MLTLALALLLPTQVLASDPLEISVGPIRSAITGKVFATYNIQRAELVVEARATGLKAFGLWKNCYTRQLNIPRDLGQPRYIYSSKRTGGVSHVLAEGNKLEIPHLPELFDGVAEDLEKETQGRCKIRTTGFVLFEIAETASGEVKKFELPIARSQVWGWVTHLPDFKVQPDGEIEYKNVVLAPGTQITFTGMPSSRDFRGE